jgi:hypothetical protein
MHVRGSLLPPTHFGPTSYPVLDQPKYILFTSGKNCVKKLNPKFEDSLYAEKFYGKLRVMVVLNSGVTF